MKKLIITTLTASAIVFSAFTLATLWKADEKASTVNWNMPNGGKAGTFSGFDGRLQKKAGAGGDSILRLFGFIFEQLPHQICRVFEN